MQIIKIISEHKRRWSGNKKVPQGFKRVEAIVREFGITRTRHINVAI